MRARNKAPSVKSKTAFSSSKRLRRVVKRRCPVFCVRSRLPATLRFLIEGALTLPLPSDSWSPWSRDREAGEWSREGRSCSAAASERRLAGEPSGLGRRFSIGLGPLAGAGDHSDNRRRGRKEEEDLESQDGSSPGHACGSLGSLPNAHDRVSLSSQAHHSSA